MGLFKQSQETGSDIFKNACDETFCTLSDGENWISFDEIKNWTSFDFKFVWVFDGKTPQQRDNEMRWTQFEYPLSHG